MVTRRMTAYWGVLAAAAMTTAVTAALAATITVFLGQGLPLAVQHDLASAPGTALSVTAQVTDPGQAVQGSAQLRSRLAAAMPDVPLSFQQAFWSGPLGLIPGALPASPVGAGKSNTALLQAASMSGIASHAVLTAGRWPAAPDGRRAIPAALPASAAALLHVGAGDVLRLRDRLTNTLVSFDITGVFVRRQQAGPESSFWSLSYIPGGGMSASGGSITYGPLVVSPAAFGPGLSMLSGSWVAQPDLVAIKDANLSSVAANVSALSDPLPDSALLNGTQLTTDLPSVLTATASDLDVARSLLVICVLQLLVLTVAALLGTGRLLAAQREDEIAMLAARGATRTQLARLTAAEVVPLLALMSVAGGLAGARLAGVLAGAAGIRLTASWPDALGTALAVALITAAALLAPGITSPAAWREESRGRTVAAGVTRAGLDIALLVLAVLAGWQLRQYSALSDNGTAGIDPVLALAPALALAAGATVTLRLLPLAAQTADRLAARGRRLTASLASWQFSRKAVRQGSTALLLVMAVAAGTLALAQHASWARSATDQAAFTAGGDLQVNLPAPLTPGGAGAISGSAGVTRAMPVAADIAASPGEVIALDTAQAARVVRLRGDESPLPPGRLFRAITPSAGSPGTVLTASGPGAIQLTATVGPAVQLGPVTMTLTVLDRTGSAYQFSWTLIADGRPHLLAASLGGKNVLYPLRVAAITATFQLPQQSGPLMTLTLSHLSLAGWTENASAAALASILALSSAQGVGALPVAGSADVTRQAASFGFSPGFAAPILLGTPEVPIQGQLVLLPPAARAVAIPAIATSAFMEANSLTMGSVVPAYLEGARVPLRIVAEVTSFPTVTAPGGALIADLGSVQAYLAWQNLPPLPVMQWWLSSAGGGVPPALAASVPAGSGITSVTGLAKAITADPLSAGPQKALVAMAGAAALLAITGFWVSIAADVRQRRAETALLAALGVTRRDTASRLFLEKVLLSLPSSAVGVLVGALVARLLVPAVTLTSAAQQPVPPALTVYDLPQAIPFGVAVAVLPAVMAVLAATRRPDPAAELRTAQAA